MATQNITFSDKSTGDTLLATDVNNIKSVVNNNSSELNTLQSTVAGMDISGISTNTTAIGTLQTNVGTLQTNVGTLQTNVGTLDTELDDITTTVQTNSAISWNYSDTDVSSFLNGSLNNHIIPADNATYDIGSAEKKIRHLFLSDNSLKFVNNSETEFSLGVNGEGQLTFNNEPVGSSGGGSSFVLNKVSTSGVYNQVKTNTHTLYDATAGDIIVDLIDPTEHIGVTQHKRIDGSTNTITLSSSVGATIDGATEYTLDTQYEAIGVYTDGTDYFIQ